MKKNDDFIKINWPYYYFLFIIIIYDYDDDEICFVILLLLWCYGVGDNEFVVDGAQVEAE